MIPDRTVSRPADPSRSEPVEGLSRRGLLRTGAAVGGGLLLGLSLPSLSGEAADAAGADGFAPNAFVRIGGDGLVVLTMPYVEMGQGTYTAIPMLIAEELEVGLERVRPEHAPPDEKLYGNPLLAGLQATGGSTAIRAAWQPLRTAGAVARTMLVAAAAAEKAGWGQPLPPRFGRGVSLQLAFGTYMAHVAEVEVAKNGEARVRRVVCGVDCGNVVNPDTVEAQVLGAIIFGITAALYGEITIKGGRVEQATSTPTRCSA